MRSHEETVHTQFDPRAEEYRGSAVHAAGEDLEHARALVAACAVRPARAIDLGCGAGHLSFALAAHVGHLVALDPSRSMLEVLARGAAERALGHVEVRTGSAESLPFPDASVSLAGTRYSAHHWSRLEAAVEEMFRVLQPGGKALVIDVVAPQDALVDTYFQAMELLRDVSHVRDRSVLQWRALLADAGFTELQYRQWPVRIEFTSWVTRMRTPPSHVAAIRSLQAAAPREVHEALSLQTDGSFTLQTGLFWLEKSRRE